MAQAPNRANLIAERFKTYKVLGEGTYGVVFIAKDMKENKMVALKKFRLRNVNQGLDFNTIQEIRQLSELNHPNIVRFIGAFNNEGTLYIATEFHPVSLSVLISNDQGSPLLSFAQIKCCMRMLLQGMKYLHENFVLHRDLKPSNILMSNGGILKIIDFGLSTEYPSDTGPMLSQVATIWYRAPELCFGARYYGPAIDMWSVGCIFAEMFLGQPFLPSNNTDLGQLQTIANVFGPLVWPGCDKLPGFLKIEPQIPIVPLSERFPALRNQVDALDLLAKLFILDPLKRITAEEALNHPYFQAYPPPSLPSELPITSRTPKSITAYLATTGLTGYTGTGAITSRVRYAPGTTLNKGLPG
ncbi:Cyclin-dependent kinase D-2 [Histomonas meleagridis]|uniref:Cyclin-dependent kinase D-2 n=1 Tax=Histomonas meleagridis TaxID=135588 RepID=UPI00355A4056|nr:Cyclin-dependent kinase D-2 [Histomonas meleagridis]KAH0805924.1 Cyclin-dependent kinase D-2 [Histomonas meleagridis]